MAYYAGIDVSLDSASICVIDATGKTLRQGKAASDPEALTGWLGSFGLEFARVGHEVRPPSQWLYAGLRQAGFAAELLETRHVRRPLELKPVKTDRKDARGIAELTRLGLFRPVHCKLIEAQETRALLTTGKPVQKQVLEIESGRRGILRGFGLKVGKTTPVRFEARIRELVAGQPTWSGLPRRCPARAPCCGVSSTAQLRGLARALARKLVAMHRMLTNGATFKQA